MNRQPHSLPAGHRAVGHGHGWHGWMMVACCLPMIVIAVALVATGIASPGFLFGALVCTVMMAVMMRGMDHGGSARADDADRSARLGRGR